jgi:hypothetical protein
MKFTPAEDDVRRESALCSVARKICQGADLEFSAGCHSLAQFQRFRID